MGQRDETGTRLPAREHRSKFADAFLEQAHDAPTRPELFENRRTPTRAQVTQYVG